MIPVYGQILCYCKKLTLQWSQKVFNIKSFVPGLVNIEGPQSPPNLKSVSVKKLVSVKIGNFTKIGIRILFLLKEKIGIGIGMLFLLEEKIGIGKVKSSKIG